MLHAIFSIDIIQLDVDSSKKTKTTFYFIDDNGRIRLETNAS